MIIENIRTLAKKTLEHYNTIIVIRPVFSEGNKYYSQVLVGECLCKL